MFGLDQYGNPYGYPPPVDAMGRPMAPGYSWAPGGQNGPQTPPQRQPEDLIIRVTGMDGAKAYNLSPNSRAALFDDTDDVVIIKTTDGAGFPSYRRARLEWIEEAPPQPAGDYGTLEEFSAQLDAKINARFDELKGLILNGKQPVSKPERSAGGGSGKS